MSDITWRVTDLERIQGYHDRHLHYTGPGNPDGFAPYTFGGRVQKWDGYWRNEPEYAEAAPPPKPLWPWELA